MPHDNDEHKITLDRIVRLATQQSEERFSQPTEDDILAYLAGHATPEQSRRVTEALLKSASFRKELGEIIRDLDRIHSLPVPERTAKPAGDTEPGAESDERRLGPTRLPILKYVAILAAAALIALMAIPIFRDWHRGRPNLPSTPGENRTHITQNVQPEESGDNPANRPIVLAMVDSNIEIGLVSSLELRSTNSPTNAIDSVYSVAKDAAFGAYRQMFYADADHNYELTPRLGSKVPAMATTTERALKFQFLSEDTSNQVLLTTTVPAPAGPDSLIAVWVLAITPRSLYSGRLRGDSVGVLIPAGLTGTLGVAITFPSSGGYKSQPVETVQIPVIKSKQ